MDERARHDRTIRLIESRLEGLAGASERAPRAALRFDREIGAVAAATRHAIALGLISADEADAVWAAVAGRHPDAEWCRAGPRLAA